MQFSLLECKYESPMKTLIFSSLSFLIPGPENRDVLPKNARCSRCN
jgi:hypothetical protein